MYCASFPEFSHSEKISAIHFFLFINDLVIIFTFVSHFNFFGLSVLLLFYIAM